MIASESSPALVRIGTRKSRLALAQAHTVRLALARAHGWPEDEENCPAKIVAMSTTGDEVQSRALLDIGGKGLFTKEIEEALLDGRVDLAVHSMKDVPTELPPGLVIAAIMEREDPRDVFIGHEADHPDDLPNGAVVGTSSLRRQAQLLSRWPDIEIGLLRGNVETRLGKVAAGEVAGTFLARAGLNRLGLAPEKARDLTMEEMLPAVAQGAVGIEIRDHDTRVRDLIAPLDHGATHRCVIAERALLAMLDGSCRTPIAGFASISDSGTMQLRGLLLSPDGKQRWSAERLGQAGDAGTLGREAGAEIKAQIPEAARVAAG
ncbi:MAG: hydroxymethylbilane synthase [Alphaproteobacteria bacterium]